MDESVTPNMVDKIADFHKITIITGAGISAPSGLPTFRGKEDSLWNDAERLRKSNIDYIRESIDHVDEMWSYWGPFRDMMDTVEPNPAHLALAKAEENHNIIIGTQNVDGLHQKAGSTAVYELHGSMFYDKCLDECDALLNEPYHDATIWPAGKYTECPVCAGPIRPDIVMFGEFLPLRALSKVEKAVIDGDLVIYIGTSGIVYPVAGFVDVAVSWGKPVWLINDEEWDEPHPDISRKIFGPCEEILPELFGV